MSLRSSLVANHIADQHLELRAALVGLNSTKPPPQAIDHESNKQWMRKSSLRIMPSRLCLSMMTASATTMAVLM